MYKALCGGNFMKKIILTALSAFALMALGSPAVACDSDKNKIKASKADQTNAETSPAAQKEDRTKTNQKS
jgi:hypothetical protein